MASKKILKKPKPSKTVSQLTPVQTLGGKTVNMGVAGQPNRVKVALKYSGNIAYSTTTVATQVLGANNAFDPDQTSAGFQPYNFDDYSALYSRYRVYASSVEWSIAADANGGFSVACAPTNSSTAFSSLDDMKSAPGVRYVDGWSSLSFDVKTQKSGGVIKQSATTKQILGEDWGDRMEALVTAAPADPWFWYIKIQSTSGGTITGRFFWVMTLHMEFFDRKPETEDYLLAHAKKLNARAKKLHAAFENKTEAKNSVSEPIMHIEKPLSKADKWADVPVDEEFTLVRRPVQKTASLKG